MLPVDDGPTEQEPHRPANLPVAGAHPYQLPPPRTSAPLQFGTDPFLRPRNRGERRGEGEESNHSRGHGYQQTNEQLPSVSQLLTPNAPLSRSPSPYNPRAFGIYLSSGDYTDPNKRARYNEPDNYLPGARSGAYESSRTQLDATGSPCPQNLPPISHISTASPRSDISPYSTTNSLSTSTSYPHGMSRNYNAERGDRTPTETSLSRPVDSHAYNGTGTPMQPQVRLHVVDERYIEGEGLCYIYADGSHCPKAIDGIPVNANWGITKAGKPRKRLAQACLTCREKKIKCHPNLPRCDQCQKSGRVCRFESA